MKVTFTLFIIAVFCCTKTDAQNVGIGETSPVMKLHVTHTDSALALFLNTQPLDVDVKTALYLKTGPWVTGAIKTTGQGTNTARLGLFTYAATNPNGLFERMSISDNGNVGVGTILPSSLLHVNGTLKITDGSQGTNKVFGGDASGLGGWRSSGLNSGFKASHGLDQTLLGTSSMQVSFTSVEYNDAAAFSSSQFTAPENGVYHFDAMITWDLGASPLTASTGFAIRIKRGGSIYHEVWAYLPSGANTPYSQTLSTDMKLTTGDIIRIEAYNGSSSAKNLFRDVGTAKYVSFAGHRIY